MQFFPKGFLLVDKGNIFVLGCGLLSVEPAGEEFVVSSPGVQEILVFYKNSFVFLIIVDFKFFIQP
jgi:hypothetical protein